MSTHLITERRGSTLLLTLSGPQTRNALSPAVYAAGVETLNVAESNDEVRSVVITGDGGHFSAGGNVGEMAANIGNRAAQSDRIDALGHWIEAIRAFPKPVIAAVEGAAAGAGCSLALACDLLVASHEARFSLAYGRIGLSPDGGITHALARGVAHQQALEWLWLGQTRSTDDLQRMGLVNRVAEPGQALSVALALAAEVNAMAPAAVCGAKELVHRSAGATLGEQLLRERECFLDAFEAPTFAEGVAAFRDKRTPKFD